MSRARLAADALGNANALDNGQPVATLVLGAWRQICSAASQAHDDLDAQRDKAREVWAKAGNYVIREYGARPWRFCSTDYQAAVQVAPNLKSRLTGAGVNATWDDTLSPVMRRCGLPIHEESVAGKMIPDLKD
jgi:hypothetical protein